MTQRLLRWPSCYPTRRRMPTASALSSLSPTDKRLRLPALNATPRRRATTRHLPAETPLHATVGKTTRHPIVEARAAGVKAGSRGSRRHDPGHRLPTSIARIIPTFHVVAED